MSFSPGAASVVTVPGNQRSLSDGLLTVAIADAGAGNTASSNSIDLNGHGAYPTSESFWAQIVIGPATGGNNTKNINAWLQHSSDNGNWTNIPEFNTALIVQACDANGNWLNTETLNVQLQPSTKQYVRVQTLTEANGGTPVGTVTLNIIF